MIADAVWSRMGLPTFTLNVLAESLQAFTSLRGSCRVGEHQHQLAHQCSPNIIGIWERDIYDLNL